MFALIYKPVLDSIRHSIKKYVRLLTQPIQQPSTVKRLFPIFHPFACRRVGAVYIFTSFIWLEHVTFFIFRLSIDNRYFTFVFI